MQGSARRTVSIRGQDFFDAAFFHGEATRPFFYRFIAELKEMCVGAEPTPTHRFLRTLIEERRVIRWYSQNIDGLEERVGLETSISAKTTPLGGGRSRGGGGPPVVGLHGTLDRLTCTVCRVTIPYELVAQRPQHEAMKAGQSPECPTCQDRIEARKRNGQRPIRGGVLRPDIVLYNEPNPAGDAIAEHTMADIAKRPTMLLVIGTSLKVVGLKRLVKDVTRAIRAHNPPGEGLVVYLNKTGVQAKSEWRSVFDCELVGEADAWVERLQASLGAPSSTPLVAAVKRTAMSISVTPCRPLTVPAKPTARKEPKASVNSRLDAFFKHTKSITQRRTTKASEKENQKDQQPRLGVASSEALIAQDGAMTRSKVRRALATASP